MVFQLGNCVLLPRSLLGPLKWVQTPSRQNWTSCGDKTWFQCNPGIDGGVEQTNIEFQFCLCVFSRWIVYYCRDHFCGPTSESRHLCGSIRRHVMKKHEFQCNPGIDGGVDQTNIEFAVFVVWFFSYWIMYYCRDHFWGSLSESRHLRCSIRRLLMKKHRFQCNSGIDGGVEQNNIEFHCFVCLFS